MFGGRAVVATRAAGQDASVAEVDKATCFITRRGAEGVELCVFEHPLAGVQLPAGTIESGEHPLLGAAREAFEESGLQPLRLVGELATIGSAPDGSACLAEDVVLGGDRVPRGNYARILEDRGATLTVEVGGATGDVSRAALSFQGVRHLVHLTLDGAAPCEWWVITPDGGGLTWRCHWVPLGSTHLLPWHQQWLDLVRDDLLGADHPPARPRRLSVEVPNSVDVFFAPPLGHWSVIGWREADDAPPDVEVGRAETVAFTGEGQLVAIEQWAEGLWSFPGGRREQGESLVDTLRRELVEEACATLEDHELLGFQQFAHLVDGVVDEVTTDALFWSRVSLLPFASEYETTARRLMNPEEARLLPFWAHAVAQRFLDRAIAVERARSR